MGMETFAPGVASPVAALSDAEIVNRVRAGDSALFRYLSQQAERAGRTLRARVRLRSFDAVCRMVESGVGIGIVSEPAARRCARTMDIAVLDLADAWALRQLSLCMRSFDGLPRHAQQLVEEIRA